MVFLGVACVVPVRASDQRDGGQSSNEYRLEDLMALPTMTLGEQQQYRATAYLKAAVSLQTMGKEKSCQLLLKLAEKDRWPNTRTLVLCRMLFRPKPKSDFRRAAIGASVFIKGSKDAHWSSDPIHIEDGVPFLVVTGYFLAGFPEHPTDYVKYCIKECDWNDAKYELRTKVQQQKALDKMIETFGLKERRTFLEAQFE
jgi:hypothetical protein